MIFGIELYSFRFWILSSFIIVGLFIFLRMLWLGRGGYKYSSFRVAYNEEYEEARQNYNRGIFPSLGCEDDDWSYGELESYIWS